MAKTWQTALRENPTLNKGWRFAKQNRVPIAIFSGMLLALTFYRFGCPPNTTNARELDECTIVGVTVLDWLELLGGPLALAIFGWWLGQWQEGRDDKKEALLKKQEEDREKEAILQNYFDRISELVFENEIVSIAIYGGDTVFEKSALDSARTLIEARTKSILRRFKDDGERTRSVLDFLGNLKIYEFVRPNLLLLMLEDLNLSGVHLNKAILHGVAFNGSSLVVARFKEADLQMAEFRGSNLSKANLEGANLARADLEGADLEKANLAKANLKWTNLKGANIDKTILEYIVYNAETVWPEGFTPPPSIDGCQAADTRQ